MSAIDDLIDEYEVRLQEIYDDRTAGSYTFVGVLSSFLMDVRAIEEESDGPTFI